MRLLPINDGYYLLARLPLHKSFEMGYQFALADKHFDVSFGLCFTGQDHAGLRFSFSLFGLFFELNVCDERHWTYKENRWMTPEEEQKDHEQVSQILAEAGCKPRSEK